MSSTNKDFIQSKTPKAFNAARVKVAKGAVTQTQTHQSETIVIVLEGAWRFQLAERAVTLRKDEALRIGAHEPYSAEALADTVALRIAAVPHYDGQHVPPPHDDPDQYLWGV